MPDPFVVDMCGLWFDNLNRGCLPSIHLFHTWTLEVTAPASATSSVGYCIHMYPPRWPELNFYKKRRARKHWSQDSLSWILMTYIKTVETCMKSLNTWLVTYGTNMTKGLRWSWTPQHLVTKGLKVGIPVPSPWRLGNTTGAIRTQKMPLIENDWTILNL